MLLELEISPFFFVNLFINLLPKYFKDQKLKVSYNPETTFEDRLHVKRILIVEDDIQNIEIYLHFL